MKSRRGAFLKAAPVHSGISTACSHGNHANCFSQKCSCSCHTASEPALKPFMFAEAKRFPDKIVTRSGLLVYELKVEFDCLSGYIGKGNLRRAKAWFLDGRYYANRKESPFDLFLEEE